MEPVDGHFSRKRRGGLFDVAHGNVHNDITGVTKLQQLMIARDQPPSLAARQCHEIGVLGPVAGNTGIVPGRAQPTRQPLQHFVTEEFHPASMRDRTTVVQASAMF